MDKEDSKGCISIGIDLSLVGTGIVVLEDGKKKQDKLVKTRPSGDKPVDEIVRIRGILDAIEDVISTFLPTIVVIEGLAFAVRNTTSIHQLAALNYMTRSIVYDYNVPFVIVAPTSLKKFITGNGASDKDVMLMEIYKRYGVTYTDDNEADAYALAQVGLALKGANKKAINQKQEEVLELIRKQL